MMRRPQLAVLALVAALLLGTGCNDARPKVRVVPGPSGSGTLGPSATSSTPTGAVTGAPGGVASTSSAAAGVTPAPAPHPAPPTAAPASTQFGLSVPSTAPLPAPRGAITVGPGPVLTRTARGDVFEQLRDWEASDLRALDPLDVRLSGDGLTASRELVAFYARRQSGRLFLRVDLLDLQYGAELGGLDLIVLLGWGSAGSTQPPLNLRERTAVPYGAALVIKDTQDAALLDAAGVAAVTTGTSGLDVAFRSDLDSVELGLDLAHLQALGWTSGRPLTFQVLAVRDGQDRAEDAVLEEDLLDRSLDQVVREDWVAPRRARLAPVVVGNRAALTASYLSDLVHSTRTTSSAGNPTGLRRTLESHAAHGLPVSVHLSGVLANAIGWASSSDPQADGPAFLARLAEFFDGNAANGEGDFLPGTYVDNVLPYFVGAPNQAFIAQAAEVYRERLGVTAPGSVFWIPERVARGDTFAELATAGFGHTVIDRTHLERWFGAPVTDGKLHRVNGIDCFVIDPTMSLFAQTDGGPSLALRKLLVQRALDPDAEQVILTVADWEEYAGHKGSPDVPDAYDRALEWLRQRPWIEVVGLQDLAGRGWSAVDHGQHASLPVETHAWLRHACEEDYDNWYYGHPLEQSFAALRPLLRPGVPHPLALGDVHTPSTLFGDTWARIEAAPAGELRDLARQAFSSTLYRTAWHREDMHDTSTFTNGQYVRPDTTYDQLSGFVTALSTRVGEAAITARAAVWAAAPPTAPRVVEEDVDLDGELEVLLMDARLLLVCERDGGRITAGFARDPLSGGAAQVLGDPLAFPTDRAEIAWEDDHVGAARNSALKDVWATGASRSYVNDASIAQVSTTSAAVTFTTSDGLLRKTIAWSAPGQVEVTYDLDPSLGTVYLRAGLNPDLAALALSGQRDLVERDAGGVYTLEKSHKGRTVAVHLAYADAGHSARRNPLASDGTTSSPRNTAFQHMVELSGDAPGFSFGIGVEVR